VEGFGLLEFGSYEAIVDSGYRYAADIIGVEGVGALGVPPQP
jgi:hypothetical protein